MGGGLPLSAVFGTEVMTSWPESIGEARHTGTFFGHPLAAAYGMVVLDVLERDGLMQRAQTLGATLREKLRESCNGVTVSGEGLMLSVDLGAPGAGVRMMNLLREQGYIAIAAGENGQSLAFSPAFNIPEALLIEAAGVVAMNFRSCI